MTKLQQAILAQLPRVDEEGYGPYATARGLHDAPDAHPLVKQATLRSLRASLGHLMRRGLVRAYPWHQTKSGGGPMLYAYPGAAVLAARREAEG